MDFIKENELERKRLETIVHHLTEGEWTRPLDGVWTAGTMLGHLAFWDRTTASRLRIWLRGGKLAGVPDIESADAINDTVRLLSAVIPFREGSRLVMACAQEIDELVGGLSAERLRDLESSGRERWFKRYLHRQTHLPKIEAALAR